MIRSHLTQGLLNYFDETDARVRETANTLDAQLLNAAAVSLEAHQLRVKREIDGRFLATCPLNLDNLGIYYRVQIPVNFLLSTDANGNLQPPASVVGRMGDISVPLFPFEDTLLAPAAVQHEGTPIPLASPKLATILAEDFAVPSITLGRLPIPNQLSFWVQGLQELQGSVILVIEGSPYPQPLWPGLAATKSETLIFTDEGLHRTNTTWASIDRISVYGLPAAGTVDVYALEMCLPFTPDEARPYSHPAHRDIFFNRYWQLDLDPQDLGEPRLNEVYYENNELGFPTANDPAPPPLVTSYRMEPPLSAIAVEPNTWGLIAVRESRTGSVALDYLDRRELMPDKLVRAALTAEPHYGLNVKFDELTRVARQVILTATPYSLSDRAGTWRYVVEVPGAADKMLYLQDKLGVWALAEFNPGTWCAGAPPVELPFMLSFGPGTYVFTLETRTVLGVVLHDSYPYADLVVTPLVSLDLDLAHVRGVAFDARQRMWIWDGNFLHPMKFVYDGCIFDPTSRSLYLTRSYDEVTVQ